MELPCVALHCDDHSMALSSASKEKLIIGHGDTDKHLQNKTICQTARGLLLVRDPGTLATFLWNPQDGERVDLPPLQGLEDDALMHSHCLLSDEPSAAGCVVLLVVEVGDDDGTFLSYCRPGDETWVKHDYDIGTQICSLPGEEERHEKTPICPIAACRGKFYFNASETELGVLEFSPTGPVFSFIVVDDDDDSALGDGGSDDNELLQDDEYYDEQEDPDDSALGDGGSDDNELLQDDEYYDEQEDPDDSALGDGGSDDNELLQDDEYYDEQADPGQAVFLVESGNELYRVTLLYAATPYGYGREIDDGFVDKWDFSELRWHGVEDLGGRTFLLSLFYFGASCQCACSDDTEHGLQQDCVYIVYPRKREMQIFDVKEGTNCIRKLDEAPTANKAFWLLPAGP